MNLATHHGAPPPSNRGEATPLHFVSAAFSHDGCVRASNEDAYLDQPEKGLWAVADGMGGHLAGGFASAMVVNALSGIQPHASAFSYYEQVRATLADANDRLREKAVELLTNVVGATAVAFLVHGQHYACIWAGDCRAYRWRKGVLTLLTRDHTVAQQLSDAGVMSPEESRSAPDAHHVTRAIGAHRSLELDTVSGDILPGDRFLLCSDGATVLKGDVLAAILGEADIRDVPFLAIQRALDSFASDNVTFLVIEAQE